MEQIFFILFLLIVGYLCKFLNFPKEFGLSLNSFVIYISLPATILLQIPKINFDLSMIGLIVTPWIVLALSVVLVLIIFKNESQNTKAALLLVIPLGNTSFFGFPILSSLLGEESVKYALIYDQLGTFLILATYGTAVLAFYTKEVISAKKIIGKIVLFPPFLFLIIALIVGEMPQGSQKYLQILSQTLVPLAIISVGFSMELKLNTHKMVFAKALVLKLIAIPILVMGVLALFMPNNLIFKVIVLESAMPSMITAGALAISAGFTPRLSAALVGYGIVISLVSLYLLNWLM